MTINVKRDDQYLPESPYAYSIFKPGAGFFCAREDELISLRDTLNEMFPAWTCSARKQSSPEPVDCDWPRCGCDPHADKVISALAPVTIPERGDKVEVKVGIVTDPETGTYKPVMSVQDIAKKQTDEIYNKLKFASGGTVNPKPYLVGEYTEPFPLMRDELTKAKEREAKLEIALRDFVMLHRLAKSKGLI